jgi:hypothetical protein
MCTARSQRLDDFQTQQWLILDHEDDASIKSLTFHSDAQPQCSTFERVRLANAMGNDQHR